MKPAVITFVAIWVSCGLFAGCAPDTPDEGEPEGDSKPVISARVPDQYPLGQPMYITAVNSFDPDGVIVSFSANFGDGTAAVQSADGSFSHVYGSVGGFHIYIEIEDDSGLSDSRDYEINIVEEFPAEQCTPGLCESIENCHPCPNGYICEEMLTADGTDPMRQLCYTIDVD